MRHALFLRRHPGDLLRGGLGLTLLFTTAAFIHAGSVGTVETDVFRLVNDFPLPGWTWPAIWLVMQFGNIASVPAVAFVAGTARRWRLAVDFAVAGGAIYLLAKLIKTLFERGRPQTLLDSVHILGEPARGLGYVSGHSAVAVALTTVAAPYLGRRTRRVVWGLAISVCMFRMYVGAHLPLDVVGGMALGWAAGALAHLVLGAPEGHASPARLRRVLDRLGLAPVDIVPAGTPTRRSATFRVPRDGEPDVFVKVAARERRDDDVLYRAGRGARRRRVGRAHTGSALREVQHEACLGSIGAAAGVRTPRLVFAGPFGNGAALLVHEWLDARPLDRVDDGVAADVRRQVESLHAAGVVHHDLEPERILVDGQAGCGWWTSPGPRRAIAPPGPGRPPRWTSCSGGSAGARW